MADDVEVSYESDEFDENEATDFNDNRDIYEGVESLLNIPGPSLKQIVKNSKKKSKKPKKVKERAFPALPNPPTQPEIKDAKNSRPRRRKGPPACAEPRRTSSKPIDPDLLAQAFAYADKLAADTESENLETQENKKKHPRRSKPSAAAGSAANVIRLKKQISHDMEYSEAVHPPNRSSSKNRNRGSKKSRKSKSQQARRTKDLCTVDERRAFSAGEKTTKNRNTAMLDMVQNFEQGLTLRQLQKELEESKASLAHSTKVIEGAAAQFYGAGKVS